MDSRDHVWLCTVTPHRRRHWQRPATHVLHLRSGSACIGLASPVVDPIHPEFLPSTKSFCQPGSPMVSWQKMLAHMWHTWTLYRSKHKRTSNDRSLHNPTNLGEQYNPSREFPISYQPTSLRGRHRVLNTAQRRTATLGPQVWYSFTDAYIMYICVIVRFVRSCL